MVKKIIKIAAAVLLVLVIAVMFVGGGSDDSSDNSSTDTTEQTSEQKEKTYKIGDKVSSNDIVFQVTKVETKKKISTKKANGTYIILTVSITNNGNDEISVSDNDFKIKNGEKTYSSSDDTWIYLDDSIVYKDINPDVTLKGKVAFDVPKKIATSKSNVLEIDADFFGLDTVEIQLKK